MKWSTIILVQKEDNWVHMVFLHTVEMLPPRTAACAELLNSFKEVIFLPVRINDIVAQVIAAEGLPAVDIGRHGCKAILGDDQTIVTTKFTVNEITEVVNVMVGRQYHYFDIFLRHVVAQTRQPILHFAIREGRYHLFAIRDLN